MSRTKLVGLFLILISTLSVRSVDTVDLLEMEISTQQKSIRVGEPLIFGLTYKFRKPQLSRQANEVFTTIRHEAFVRIEDQTGTIVLSQYTLRPSTLLLRGTSGLEYSAKFVLLYDFSKKGPIFKNPGVYAIQVFVSKDYVSNSFKVAVEEAFQLEDRGLSLLSSFDDYALLQFGLYEDTDKRAKAMAHLSSLAEECGDTLLAKWARGRLGLEYYKDFHEQHPTFGRLSPEQQKVAVEDEVFEKTIMSLSKATALPDEFPLREEILYRLYAAESMSGNDERAASLMDELAAKYPHGKYARMATRPRPTMPTRRPPQSARPSFFVSIAAALVLITVVLITVGLIHLFRKRAGDQIASS